MIWLYGKWRALKNESAPSVEFKSTLRAEILRSVNGTVVYRTTRFFRLVIAPLSLVLLLGVGTTSYAYASPSVCHGHLLYPLKTGVETMESTLYRTPQAKAYFQVKSLQRREDEVNYALDHGQPTFIILQRVPQQFDLTAEQLRQAAAVRALHEARESQLEERAETEMRARAKAVLEDFRSRVQDARLEEEDRTLILRNIDLRLESFPSM